MKKLLILAVMSMSIVNSLFASEVPCKFTVKSNLMNNVINNWDIDGTSESVLIGQGKEVTRSNDEANFRIYITHTYENKETLLSDIIGMGYNTFKTNKKLTIEVQRNDGVVVYTKTIRGDNSESNKEKLLNSLSKINFKCSDN